MTSFQKWQILNNKLDACVSTQGKMLSILCSLEETVKNLEEKVRGLKDSNPKSAKINIQVNKSAARTIKQPLPKKQTLKPKAPKKVEIEVKPKEIDYRQVIVGIGKPPPTFKAAAKPTLHSKISKEEFKKLRRKRLQEQLQKKLAEKRGEEKSKSVSLEEETEVSKKSDKKRGK